MERPILFRDRLVRAILEGRKTQTRRLMNAKDVKRLEPHLSASLAAMHSRYGLPGDRLWVREAWARVCHSGDDPCTTGEDCAFCRIEFRADTGNKRPGEWPDDAVGRPGWKPGIHLHRKNARIVLDIVEVRVERLQDITEEDAIAEGLERHESGLGWLGFRADGGPACFEHPRMAFASLWDSINGQREGASWTGNPWVWAITFRRVPP